jgi:O-antigen ligase
MKYSYYFEKTQSVLLILLPFALITGPFIPDLFVTIISTIFIVKCFSERKIEYFNNIYFKYFLFFYLFCLTSSIMSEYKLISSIKSLFYLRFGLFSLAVWCLLKNNRKLIDYIFLSLLFCFFILIFDGLFQFLFDKNIIGLEKHPTRLSSFFGEELIYGSYLSRFLPILIGLFFFSNYSQNKINTYIAIIFIIFSITLIYLSGERTAFFLVIMSIIYLVVMINKYSKYFLIASILSFFVLVTITINNPIVKERMINLTKNQIGLNNIYVFSRDIYKGHFLIAKDLFQENIILGVGPKNYVQHCNNNKKYQTLPYVCSTHPHNTYIQLLAETGLIGFFIIFFLFLTLTFYSIKYIYLKLWKKKELFNFPEICLLSSMLITVWPLITSGSFFNNYLNIIYFFPVGIFIWSRET